MGILDKMTTSRHREPAQHPSHEHRKWVDALMREEELVRELRENEKEFIEDMDALLRLGGNLNRKQEVWLERLYAEKTP